MNEQERGLIPDNLLISIINLEAIQKRNTSKFVKFHSYQRDQFKSYGFPSPINLNVPERFIKNFSDSFLLKFNFSLNFYISNILPFQKSHFLPSNTHFRGTFLHGCWAFNNASLCNFCDFHFELFLFAFFSEWIKFSMCSTWPTKWIFETKTKRNIM